jgi:hypothetical protein
MTEVQRYDLNELLSWDPIRIESWLSNFASSEPPPEDFNWLGLAEVAASRAAAATDGAAQLAWGRIAQAAYEHLSSRADPASSYRHTEDAMRLRAELIRAQGPRSNDPLLDCDEILDWFLQNVDRPVDEIRQRTARWRELDPNEVLELRRLKNRLAILRRLDRCPGIGREEIARWLALWELLP